MDIKALLDNIFLNDMFVSWIPVLATIMILSFLYRDNPLYKIGENIFIGVALGYGWILSWEYIVDPFFIMPVKDMFVEFHFWDITYILWFLLALTMFFRFSRKNAWVANYYFGFLFGYMAGYYIPIAIQNILRQSTDLMKPINQGSFFESSKWFVIIFGTFAALMYFFFSKPHRGLLGKTARVGIVVMMIFFGAAFGSTVMGRVSLFIDRALLLVEFPMQSIVCTIAVIIYMIIYFKFIKKEKLHDDESFI
ncbi:MAG: hypothetical protein PHF33_09130 [Candidatus Delongbacteria bacterium]|nr:hypothetical protein [Candidatus Delongbacteria bacterium]MDD4206121.1 hypothetical protein [Candidatus Delongbacteria bacterium]MDY0017769.1 hypothetical protein [Candidatus Delongbacteria bacterium]